MKGLMLVAVGLALAGCESMPQMPTMLGGSGGPPPAVVPDSPRQAQFVALVEQNGCRVAPEDDDHQFVHDAGFTDLEIGEFGKSLAIGGRAEVTDDGGLVLLTEGCL